VLQDSIPLDRWHRIVPVAGQRDMVLFVPPDLPPHTELHLVLPRVEQLTFQLGRLSEKLEKLPDPHALQRLISQWDAVIAGGSHDRSKDLLCLLAGPHSPGLHNQANTAFRSVVNCATLNEQFVLGSAQAETVDDIEALIRVMHQTLTRQMAVDGDSGVYRSRVAGSLGFVVEGGRIGPPPPDWIADCMRALAEFIVTPPPLPFLVRLAMAWGQLLAIAPFSVGNEAVCHALVASMIGWQGYPPIFMSEMIAQRAQLHRQAQEGAILRGDWVTWCEAVFGVIESSIMATERYIERTAGLPDLWRKRLDTLGLRADITAYAVLKHFPSQLVFDAGWIGRTLDINHRTANRIIPRLVEAEIAQPYRIVGRKQLYYVPEILSIFSPVAVEEDRSLRCRRTVPRLTTRERSQPVLLDDYPGPRPVFAMEGGLP
jgi:Fic family protein